MKELKGIIKNGNNYMITRKGDVINKTTQYVLKPYKRKGYYSVSLLNSGERTIADVHRLVALAFLPREDETLVVNHKDHNCLNNNVDNLEWVTQQYNVRHAIEGGMWDGPRVMVKDGISIEYEIKMKK